MKKSIIYLLTIVGVFIFVCSKVVSSETFIFNLKSYSSVSEIKEFIRSKNGTYTVDKSSFSNLANIPENEIIIVKTNLFKENKFIGKTDITFWNNKLMEVAFFPNNHIKYMKYFKKERNINSSNIKETKNLHIEIVEDYQGTYYEIFTDIRLKKEMDDWIREYS
jgi:hypothetical protein